MAEIRTVTTLRTKLAEIEAAIRNYEKRLDQARADYAHVAATIAIMDAKEGNTALLPYDGIKRLFRYGELAELARDALQDGEKDTRQLALYVMERKGLDTGDKVLASAVALRLVNSLNKQLIIGKIASPGKKGGVRVWTLPLDMEGAITQI